jgi:hypothetical protein
MATSALIVIDVLNPYQHEDADELSANVEGMVAPLRELIERAHESDGRCATARSTAPRWSTSCANARSRT